MRALEKEATARAVVDNAAVKPLLSADDLDTWHLPKVGEATSEGPIFRCVGSEAAMMAMRDVAACIQAGSWRGAVHEARLIDDILSVDSDMRLNKRSRQKVCIQMAFAYPALHANQLVVK
jgi:hypothetical protein